MERISRPTERFPVVGIGASAGGVEAFQELLAQLTDNPGMAFVLVQHLDPTHESHLEEALTRATVLPMHEITDGMRIAPNHVYVTPSNVDVGIRDDMLTLTPRPAGRKPHLSIDSFFKELASACGRHAIGVVLSGTGADGSEGLRAIKAEGGIALVQDPKSARSPEMPAAALATGVVDMALSLAELGQELVRLGRHPFLSRPESELLTEASDESAFAEAVAILLSKSGVDFREYKEPSVRRRLSRRMTLRRLTTLQEYVALLRNDADEVLSLYEDILIHVTSFFREPSAFEELKRSVFPTLLQLRREEGIRLWCAGCASGEEAYSLVIALLEFLASQNAGDVRIQLFGTDISEKTVERARAGVYGEGIARDVSPERLTRYFTRIEGGYRISRAVRERCAFVKHDLASSPPFSKLDLISCRNVLIYFGAELQRRTLETFHFALNPGGFLLLGHAEGVADTHHLFTVVDKDSKLFARSSAKSVLRLSAGRDSGAGLGVVTVPGAHPPGLELVRRTEAMLLERYAPPGVIVNERMEILHFRGRTGPYLEPAPGAPQHDLLRMARPGLMVDLRLALIQAKTENIAVRRAGVRVEQDGIVHTCDIVVLPVAGPPKLGEHIFAVLFEESAPPPVEVTARALPSSEKSPELRLVELAEQLEVTREFLRTSAEEQQRTHEELLAANEELLSSNEELQSLNEALETAKEELQSTNEELSTLNEELSTRNAELYSTNSDLTNVLGSVEVPIVIVDGARNIRRITPKARPVLNLLPTDVGRPIDDIKPSLGVAELDAKIARVIETLTPYEEEVAHRDGRWYRLQIRPYTTVDKKIDGAVISVIDIDALKRALGAAEWARDYARATVEAVQTPFLVLDSRLCIMSFNEAFRERYKVSADELRGHGLFEIMGGAWNTLVLRGALEAVVDRDHRFQRTEAEMDIPGAGKRVLSLSGRAVATPNGERMVLLAIEDATERLRAEAERTQLLEEAKAATLLATQANQTKDVFLATLSHELRTPLSTLLLQAHLLTRGELDEAGFRRAGKAIERATRAQARLINDLLDVSRIASGKLHLETAVVSMEVVVASAIETVTSDLERKGLELTVSIAPGLPQVRGDADRLQQVVLNLLTNSIKFTPHAGHLFLTLEGHEHSVRLQVRDTGVGIEPAFLPNIFTRFWQESGGSTRAHGGLGLGLAIVRHLVEAHGGSVHAFSEGKGKGATFTILLPALEQEAMAAAPRTVASSALAASCAAIKDKRILVVDDDQATGEALRVMLHLCGAEVHVTDSAARAMRAMDEFRPELLVCDLAMPEEDGYQLIRRIRLRPQELGGAVPALALSAHAAEEDRQQALRAGFQLHLGKPLDIDRLSSALSGLVQQASAPPASA